MINIEVLKGDITKQETDAIVNAANNELLHGGGMSASIVEAGGPEIQEQSNKIAPIPLGEAAITEGGKLPAKYVIHAASMSLGQLTEESNLRNSIRNSLLRAKESGLKSIAIPAIGTGVGQFPFEKFAEIAVEEIQNFLSQNEMERIVFVFLDDDKVAKFKRILEAKIK